MRLIRILALGDVVGTYAAQHLAANLYKIREKVAADFTVVNVENTAAGSGNGTDTASARALLAGGADVLTGGNHTFSKREYHAFLEQEPRALRPANLPGECPGEGYTVVSAAGVRILCINLLGRVYMQPNANCPFAAADAILHREEGKYDLAVVDMHAEATAERIAMGRYLDGKAAVVFGTHTHVQTADKTILPHGTGYLTDLGMCGGEGTILGMDPEPIIERFRTQLPAKFSVSPRPITVQGALFTVDADTGCTTDVETVSI